MDATAADAARPLYRRLADHLAGAIRGGTLPAGARLPSVRQAAREQLVSVATVLQAYRALEDEQLVQARPKSGYFVAAAPRGMRLAEPGTSSPPEAPLAVDIASLYELMIQMLGAPGVVSLGAACPASALYPGARIRRAVSQAALRHRALLTHYPGSFGEETLRRAIARRALAMGLTLDARDIVATGGCNEAIALGLRAVTRPGDTVALESPTSFGFLQILEAQGLRALEIPTHPRHGLSVDALALALQTQPVRALLAVPTLQNPLGACMPVGERRRLAQLLARHQVPMIEDVIYNDLAERDEHRRAVKSFDTDGLVMVCGSFAKTVAPGLRVGWIEAGRYGAEVRRIKPAFGGGNTGIVEMAMADLLNQPGYEPGLRRLRRALGPRMAEARELVAAHFPRGSRVTDPAGGIMLWVEMPAAVDSIELFRRALAAGICIAPGTMFSASDRYRHCLRLSLGGDWDDSYRGAITRVGALACALAAEGARPAAPRAANDEPRAA
ncbi:PLP-dependent aminotransferase family protein [Rubrivivax sp. JA1024]|nr:PLP-dependent aminotransferase family protein [Rubrivivax sp. JA1024]